MTSFTNLIADITPDDGGFATHVPVEWQQGRTTYGGLSAALCVAGALRTVENLPPLRSAQFAFIGPASGPLRITASVLRQGKNSVFIAADLIGDSGLATHAMLSFAGARASQLSYRARPAPAVTALAEAKGFFPSAERPQFTRQFEMRRAGGRPPAGSAPEPDLLLWIRHNDPGARSGLPGLIALADALPPAAITMFPQWAPISTMTWSIDMLEPELAVAGTGEGWHIMQSRGDHAKDGYTSQDMVLWNEDLVPLMVARQTIAIFI
jgi:acyl-CoA thioesterase